MMYVSFGLILLMTSVHGEVIQCLYGGLNEASCYTHLTENKTELDKPYKSYGVLQKPTSQSNSSLRKRVASLYVNEFYYPKNIRPEVFLQQLVIDETRIEDYWNYVYLNGTDTQKLKFHSKIMAIWYKNQPRFTSDRFAQLHMMILKSFYDAASIHYFTKNNIIAVRVAEEGLEFYDSVKAGLYKNKNINVEDVMVWEILILSLKIDALGEPFTEELMETKNNAIIYLINIYSIFISFVEDEQNKYPSAFLLMYRRVLLYNRLPLNDMEYPSSIIENLINILNKGTIAYDKNHYDNALYQIYNSLMLPYILIENNKNITINLFINLLDALKKPILTTEDRLLNEKVVSIALSSIRSCVNISGWIKNTDEDFCGQLGNTKFTNSEYEQIFAKLISMEIYSLFVNYNLKSILISNNTINDDKVHMLLIQTMNMNVNSITYTVQIDIVLNAISILKGYYEANSKFGMTQDAISNMIQACKWLIELYEVLCNGLLPNIDEYQQKADEYLKIAKQLRYILIKSNDDHLSFLIKKKSCLLLYPPFDWESKIRVTGWIQNKKTNEEKNNCKKLSRTLKKKNPFISDTDVLIILYRYWMAYNNGDKALQYLNRALKASVVTLEDRARNKEANELLSMHLMFENYMVVKNN